jgi:RNA polymerase sigma factor (sigma-70 family)
MATKPLREVIRYLHGAVGCGGAEPSDSELLTRFTDYREPAALEALVRRHQQLVMNVCRRLLGPGADADDAFQATFFVLARKARSIRKQGSIASWLHGVAHRLSRQLLGKMSTRRRCEAKWRSAAPSLLASDDPAHLASMRELGAVLDDELGRLPTVCRAALIACHLEGLSNVEAAHRLGVPASTLKSRLRRGRELLRQRLGRRGVGLSMVALTVALGEQSRAGASPTLLQVTVQALLSIASTGTAPVATRAGALAIQALRTTPSVKVRLALLAVLALALAGLGAAFSNSMPSAPAPTDRLSAGQDAALPEHGKTQIRLDRLGDPLPPSAIMRLGTARLRQARGVEAVAFTPDGQQVVSAGDHKIVVWDAATGKEVRKLEAINVMGLTTSRAAGVMASAQNGTLQVWNLATWEKKFSHEVSTFAVAVSPDGSLLASGGRPTKGDPVVLWNLRTGEKLRTLAGKMPQVFCLAFSPDGKTLAAGSCGIPAFAPDEGSRSEIVRLWDVETGQLHELDGHAGGVTSLAFSPDGKILATGGHDGTLALWETATRKRLHKTQIVEEAYPYRKGNGIDSGGILALAFAPDGKTIASANHDSTVRLFDAATGKELRILRGHANRACGVAYSPDGKTLASSSDDHTVRLWDAVTGELRNPRPGHDGRIDSLVISPDGKRAVSAGGDRTVRIWDLTTGQELQILRDFKNDISALALAPDGAILAVGMVQGTLQLRGAASGAQLRELKGHTGQILSLSFSPDGKSLASASPSGKNSNLANKETGRSLRLWEVKTGQELPRIEGNRSDWYARFSPDGKWLAAYERGVDLYEPATGKKQRRLADLSDFAFLPDGKGIAGWSSAPRSGVGGASYGTEKGMVRIKSLADGSEHYSFEGPERMPFVEGLFVLSPDGRLLALAVSENSFDPNVLQLWEMATGKLRRTLKGHGGQVNRCVFSPDGRLVLSASSDTTILVWDLELPLEQRPQELTAKALASLWHDLGDADAGIADRAIWRLVAAPKQALPLLQKNLPPTPAPDPAWRAWVKDLGSEKFAVRDKASRDLEALEEQAYPLLKEALAASPPLEMRQRIERLLDRLKYPLTSPKMIRAVRAVEILEHIGTAQARQVLYELAQGGPGARLTEEARASLQRLDKSRAP